MFQNANLSRARDGRLHASGRAERGLDDALGDRPEAARPNLPGPRDHGPHGRLRVALRRPGRAVRHDDQPLAHVPEQRADQRQSNPCCEYMFLDDTACNLASINLMKFRRPDGAFDAERFKAACADLLHRAGDPGGSCQLSDGRHRPQQPPVPAAGAGILEPGQPVDGGRHCRTIRTKPAACAAR